MVLMIMLIFEVLLEVNTSEPNVDLLLIGVVSPSHDFETVLIVDSLMLLDLLVSESFIVLVDPSVLENSPAIGLAFLLDRSGTVGRDNRVDSTCDWLPSEEFLLLSLTS